MVSVKKIMQQQLALRMMLIVVLAAAYLVVADPDHEHDDKNNNNEVINRKLMKLEPQPNCGGLGAYCDQANWCCGNLECKRNPRITDGTRGIVYTFYDCFAYVIVGVFMLN
ncbi:hypothetical protein L484_024702 [Morus notabilis]|uniref:Uncharacterized protein n=1 Tax=Morus notabilis TaxID=981085 RepID=W9R4M0_9ROSA|nr:hypothetical protein L484_024702 [Morus notabilis]